MSRTYFAFFLWNMQKSQTQKPLNVKGQNRTIKEPKMTGTFLTNVFVAQSLTIPNFRSAVLVRPASEEACFSNIVIDHVQTC